MAKKSFARDVVEIKPVHVEMADCLIQNPSMTKKALGKKFGMSMYHVALVMNSKEWVDLLEEREVINPLVKANIDDRFKAITYHSQEILMERLSKPKVKDATVLKALEISSKALGYGKTTITQNNVEQFIVQLPDKAVNSQVWEAQFKEVKNGNDSGSGTGTDGFGSDGEGGEHSELQRERPPGGHLHGGSDPSVCREVEVVSDH
jgi:hypothetical protein